MDQSDMDKVMEAEFHGSLKSGSTIFKSKWHNSICKRAPRVCESSLVLVLFPNLNLVITKKNIHERKDFMVGTRINDLVNKWSGEVVFGTFQIQVVEISTYMDGTLFFINGNMIRNPSGICNGLHETCCAQFLNLDFDRRSF